MSNILVTGGLGFIGSHLVERLCSEGNNVTVVDNLSSGSLDNVRDDVFSIIEDIMDIDTLYHPNIDIIYHLAGMSRIQPSLDDPIGTLNVNIMGTAKICELARLRGATVVYAGSCSFYEDDFLSPYSFSKWSGEEVCKMYHNVYGLKMNIARFFNVYGPIQKESGAFATVLGIFEKQYREGKPLTVTGTGNQKRDFIHVSDIVDGLIRMSENPKGDVYNLATSKSYSIKEIAEMFDTDITYIPRPEGEDEIVLADVSKTISELGWKPNMGVETYIKQLL